jgi:hypothetical protein
MARNLAACLGENLDRGAVRRKAEAICYLCEHPEWIQYDLTAGIGMNVWDGLWRSETGSDGGELLGELF